MKKCASCTKDLPDAALHCVFCGAKQAPAPAAGGPPLAKTVMGNFSQADMLEHLRKQGVPPGTPGAPAAAPPAVPFAPAVNQSGGMAPAPAAYIPASHGSPTLAPDAAAMATPATPANAKTMFLDGPPPGFGGSAAAGGGNAGLDDATVLEVAGARVGSPPALAPQPQPQPIQPQPFRPQQYPPPQVHQPQPQQPQPMSGVQMGGGTPGAMGGAPMPMGNPRPMFGGAAPMPTAGPVPQYLASNTAARAGRPIEPWQAGLRLMMFLWGGALLLLFVFPVMIDPLVFNWDLLANAQTGKQMVQPLLLAGTGLLAIVFAAIPLATVVRGSLALVLGLAGALTPLLINGLPEWPMLTSAGGMILLIPGLLLRDEYRDSILPRILVTLGAILALLIFVVPQHGEIMIVNTVKALIEAPGSAKVLAGVMLGYVVLLLLTLLAWLPAPATGGAKILMWLFLVWPAIMFGLFLVLMDDAFGGSIGNVVTRTPGVLLSWVGGLGAPGGGAGSANMAMLQLLFTFMAIPTAFGVFIGYGGASTLGKSLE